MYMFVYKFKFDKLFSSLLCNSGFMQFIQQWYLHVNTVQAFQVFDITKEESSVRVRNLDRVSQKQKCTNKPSRPAMFQTFLPDCSWTVRQKCFYPKGSLTLSQRDKNVNQWCSEAIRACYRSMKGSGQLPADLSLCRSHSAKHLRCKLNKVLPLLFTDALTICCEHLIAARRQKPQTPWELWWSK